MQIRPNGCTFFPDGDYTSCCNKHDLSYVFGASRLQADIALRECMKERGHYILAWLVFWAVRAFGWIFWIRAKRKLHHYLRLQDVHMEQVQISSDALEDGS